MDGILANAKAPGGRTLDAVQAYESIIEAVEVASKSAEDASADAESAASMVRTSLQGYYASVLFL